MVLEPNTGESSNETIEHEEVKEVEKTEEEPFFRTTQGKVKFGIEIALMLIIGFLCTYPLVLFLGNFLR